MTLRITFEFKDQSIQQSIPVEVPPNMSFPLQYQLCKDRVCRLFHMKESELLFIGVAPLTSEIPSIDQNTTTIKITAEIPNRWVDHFMSMLKHMEHLGSIGSSRVVGLFSDGDGDFRPKFYFDRELNEVKPVKNNSNESIVCDILFDAG